MDLPDLDMISLQEAQAGFKLVKHARLQGFTNRQGAIGQVGGYFGGNHHLIAFALKGLAKDPFAFAITARRVDQVNATVDSGVDNRHRRVITGATKVARCVNPIIHPQFDRAQRQRRDA